MSHRDNRAAMPPRVASAPSWDELYPLLPADQQAALMMLARRQGYLTLRDLPAVNGATEHARPQISTLIEQPRTDQFPPFDAPAIVPIDQDLDETQRLALARALATPDLSLVAGPSGTGKSRLITEVIRQLVRRGQRVLFVAPSAEAIDVVLERLDGDGYALPLRALARNERFESLTATVRRYTSTGYAEQHGSAAQNRASTFAQTCIARLTLIESDLAILDQCAELAARGLEIDRLLTALEKEQSALPQQLEVLARGDSSDPFSIQCREIRETGDGERRRCELERQRAADERDRAEAVIHELESELAQGQSRATARSEWKILKKEFWQGLASSSLEARLAELHSRLEAEKSLRAEAAASVARWEQSARDADASTQSNLERLTQVELSSRVNHCVDRAQSLKREQCELQEQWRLACARLSDSNHPEVNSIAEIRAAAAAQRDCLHHDVVLAEHWKECMTDVERDIPGQVLAHVNVVAAPLAAVNSDETIAALSTRHRFDLLIVDDAHRIGESDLAGLMRRADRCLLVGDLPSEEEFVAEPASAGRPAERRGNARRAGTATLDRPRTRASTSRLAVWSRLWCALHADGWYPCSNRLACRLRPLGGTDHDCLESEPCADRPDIELRLHTPTAERPTLAEVLFPPGMPLTEAKRFLVQEFNELPVPSVTGHWEETSNRLVWRLPGGTATTRVDLQSGIVELVRDLGWAWQTLGFEFELPSWSRESADAWIQQTLHPQDVGRTTRLGTPHRMRPALASAVSALGVRGWTPRPAPPTACTPVLEFIPVPALPTEARSRRRVDIGAGLPRRLPALRNGAGLELDLSDPRHRERLPSELRTLLPMRGFVNAPEAQGIVRLLEALVAGGWSSSLAVVPLYDGQADYLNYLIRRSPSLTTAGSLIRVGTPAAMRQREADTVIIGLTRSHGHRAVSYGEDPEALMLSLTRARQRLILVGDLGTLMRRAQWSGPLEQWSAAAAASELRWITALLTQLQESSGPPLVHLHEGPP